MATRDWASLGFTPTLTFALPTERQLAQSSLADSGKGAEYKFNPTDLNAQLLASLGYGGQGLSSTGDDYGFGSASQWSDDARTWLANNGYTVGVAHDPGTSPGGRPEYYGLVDKNGQYVTGQDEPTMTVSDTLMDQITPFALMAAPFAAQAIFGGAAGGAGTLSAVDGITSLTAQGLSPSALGLTGAIAPGVTASELAALSAALPESGASLGAAGGISTLGGGSTGVTSLGSAWSPEALGLTSGITPGASAAEISALSEALPDAVSIGGAGGMTSADKAAMYGNEGYGQGMTGAQTSAYDTVLGATGSKGLADVVANSTIGSGLLNGISGVANLVGGGQNLAALLGAGLGAASGGGTQTSSRDPWSAAQPFLRNILGDAETQRARLAAQPYTPQQTAAYGSAFAGLDQARAALPGLLSWGQSAMQRQNTVPSYQQLFGGQQPAMAQPVQGGGTGARALPAGVPEFGPFMNPTGEMAPYTPNAPAPDGGFAGLSPDHNGLLSRAPTAQAGGVGGLLGIPTRQALGNKPRGLIG